MKNKIIFCILAMLISFAANKATAQDSYEYYDEHENKHTHNATEIVDVYGNIQSSNLSDGWYHIRSYNTVTTNFVTISGDVYLILGMNSSLTIDVLTFQSGSSLTIYELSNGKLTINSITGDGTLIINGCTVKETFSNSDATIIINGGKVNVTDIDVNELTINGGKITVSGTTKANKITLSWNSESDEYTLGTLSAKTLEIADGKVFVIEGTEYSGTITAAGTIEKFNKKTLTPPTYPVPNITLTPIDGIKYDGEPHQLLTVEYPDGEITDGQLVFSVDGGDWSSLPMATNIGSHTIKYKIISNTPKYADSESKSYSGEVEIEAKGSFTQANIYYVILDDDNVQVGDGTNCAWQGTGNPKDGKITIPVTVSFGGKTYTVTKIGDNAFCYFGLKTVEFEASNSIKTIGANAFAYNENLVSVNLEACTELTTIGGDAFTWSYMFESITIPSNVKVIGNEAFSNCGSLKSVTIADGSVLETIGEMAFFATLLPKITLPASIKSIGSHAFDCDDCGWGPSTSFTLTCNAIVAPSLGFNAFRNTEEDYHGGAQGSLVVPLCGSGYSAWAQYFEEISVINVTETTFSNSYTKIYDGSEIMTIAENNRPTYTFTDGENSFAITPTAVTFWESDENEHLTRSPYVGKNKRVKVIYNMSQTTGQDDCPATTDNVITLSSTNNMIEYVGDVYIPAKSGSMTFNVGVHKNVEIPLTSNPSLPTDGSLTITYQYDDMEESLFCTVTTNGAAINDYVLTSPDGSDYPITINLHVEGEMYAVYNSGTLTFKYGDKSTESSGTVLYDLTTFNAQGQPGWISKSDVRREIKYVVFDKSFGSARPTNCQKWFYGCTYLESISGLQYFHTDDVTSMESMFEACESLERLDLSHFNTSSVTTMAKMFNGMSAVKAIYVGNKWKTASTTTNMFLKCESLVGGLGTPYEGSVVDGTRAKIDGGTTDKGYFTDIAKHGYAVYDKGTLTFKCGEIPADVQVTVYELPSDGDPAWLANSENIAEVVFENGFEDVYVSSCEKWFYGCTTLATITGLTNLNTSNVTNMSSMFSGCTALSSIDLSKFNTERVTDMSGMFEDCTLLASIDLSSFDTKNVENFDGMFSGCTALTKLPTISKITLKENTAVVVEGMFAGSGLTEIDLRHWAGNDVTSFTYLFQNCKSLTKVNLSGVITTNATSIDYMFNGCSALESVDLSNSVTDQVTTMYFLFYGCKSLTVLDLSSFDTKNVTDMGSLFDGCENLTTIKVKAEGWNTAKVTAEGGNSTCIFQKAYNLIGDKGTTPKDAADTDPYSKFAHPDGGTSDPGYLSTSDKYKIFYNGIDDDDKTLDTYTNAVTEFLNEEVTLKNPTKPGYIFDGWTGTPITGLPSTPTKDVTIPADAVGNRIYTANWTVVPAYAVYDNGTLTFKVGKSTSETGTVYTIPTDGSEPGWLANKSSITTVVFDQSFDASRPVSCAHWFEGCAILTSLSGMQYFHTDEVESMESMFSGCEVLTVLDLHYFDTGKVTNMLYMFYNAHNLRTIVAGANWTTTQIVESGKSSEMFYECTNIVGGRGTTFDPTYRDKTYAKIDGGPDNKGFLTGIDNYGYAVYHEGTLTFESGTKPASIEGTVYELPWGETPSWMEHKTDITEVGFESGFKDVFISTCSGWFADCAALTTIKNLSNLNTSTIVNMENMFSGCKNLSSIDLSSFNTQSVIYFSKMFANCEKLTTLPGISKITLNKNVSIWVDGMFSGSGLTAIDLSHWAGNQVGGFPSLFEGCTSLKTVNLSGVITANASSLNKMFHGCSALESVDLSNSVTESVDDMSEMFQGCESLEVLDLSSFNTTSVGVIGSMFAGCTNLTTIKVGTGWSVSCNSENVFLGDKKLIGDKGTLYKSNITSDCGYARIDGGTSNPGYLTTGDYKIFYKWSDDDAEAEYHDYEPSTYSYSSTEAVTIPNPTTRPNTGAKFLYWTRLISADEESSSSENLQIAAKEEGNRVYVMHWAVPYAELSSDQKTLTFKNGEKPTSGTVFYLPEAAINPNDAPAWYGNVSNVTKVVFEASIAPTTCRYWFGGMTNLQEIDGMKNYLDTKDVEDMESMFFGCSGLTGELDISSLNTANVKNMSGMFSGCLRITSIKFGSNFSTANVKYMISMFSGCAGLTSLNLNGFNTASVERMNDMFSGCSSLKALDLRGFNTGMVTDMSQMFYNCSSLTAILVGADWNTEKVIFDENNQVGGSRDMFASCSELIGNYGARVGTSNDKTYAYATATDGNKNGYLTADDYKIFYNGIDDDDASLDTYTSAVTKYLNEEVTLATPTKAGYIFKGWTGTAITGLTDPNNPVKSVTIAATEVGNRIYTANWTVVPAYAVYNNGTLTFKVGDSNSESGNVYAIPTDGSEPGWLDKKANITTVVFDPSFDDARPVNCKQWFSGCAGLTSVSGLQYFHTDNVTDMSDMFYGCKAIRLLNLVAFNTSKVTNMASMFFNMDELKVIYADGNIFKVSNTATTTNMFYNCKNLVGGAGTPYDASIVDGTRAKVDGGEGGEGYFTDVANYGYAVYNSGKLTFKKGVEPAGLQGTVYELVPVNMSYTEKDNEGNPHTLTGNKPGWYNERENITEVEFESGFESVIVRTCFDWFKGCTNLTTITGLTNLNTSEVTDMSNMFNGCVNLGTIDISNFNTQNVWDFRYMFANCAKVSSLAVEKITFNTTKYPNLKIYVEGMFSGSGLTSVDVKHWSTTPLSSYAQLFAGCSKLQSVNVTGIVTAATSSIDYMFQGCSSLKSVDASSFVTSGVTHMNNLFDGCSGLTSVDVSSFNTGNVRYMTSMFEGCSSLNVLDISSFNTQSVEDMNRMFALCDNLTTIKVSSSGWTTSSLVTSNSKQNLFKNDYSLIGNDGTFCDISIYGNNPVEDALYAHAGNGGYLTTGDYKIFYDIDIDDGYVIFTPTDQITLKDGSATISASYAGGSAVSLPALADRDADDPFKNWVRTTQNSAGQIVNGSDAVSAIAATEKGNRIYTAKWTLSKEKYVTFDAAAGTLTFKYDADKPATGTYSLNTGSAAPEWSGVSSNIKSVVFEDAMLPSTCYHWFAGCTGLTVLDLTKLNTSKVTNMEGMFDGCTNLTAILVGDVWSTANVSESDGMFNGCTSLIGDGGVWAATGDLDKTYAFARDENGNAGYLTKGKYKIFFKENGGVFSSTFTSPLEYDNNVTLANPTKSNSVFWGWKQATAYDKSQGKLVFSAPSKEVKVNKNSGNYYFEVVWGTPYAVLSDEGKTLTFGVYDTKPDGAHDLNTTGDPDWIDGTNANITKVKFEESFKDARPTTCRHWFSDMSQLENIENLTYLNTSSVTSLFGMFSGCVKLTSLDFSKFNTAQVATMGQMFSGCAGLTVLDLSSFATKDALKTNQMFESCKNLTTIKVSASWDNEKITGTSEKMFDGCTALIGNSGKTVDAVIDATCAHAGTNGYLTTGDYKIFYNGIDDDATTLDTYTGAVSSFLDEKVTLKTPTKDGYTFSGWTGTSITGLTTPTKEVTIAANAAGNRIYTAHWTANEYSLNLPEGWEAYDESNNKITTATIGQKVFVKYKSTGGKTPKNVKVFPMPKSISITTTSPQTLAVGKKLQLEWSILPKDDVLPEDLKVTWESSEVSVATVSSDGIVTAVDTGTATITAETVNGKTATITINVE